jgi:hypothetical protein
MAVALAIAPGCSRNTGEAGVKPIGVGFDPGDLYAGPEARGGIIDAAVMEMKGTHLDLGVTGFFNSGDAFVDPVSDPFKLVLGFSYLFSPAILSADEWQLATPKGPDLVDDCLVQLNSRGPLGSFRTVDVGDEMVLTNGSSDPALRTEFSLARSPQDYPSGASVSVYYSGVTNYLEDHPLLPSNWAYDEDIQLHFAGGLPPDDVAVASIPMPSSQEDPRVDKDAGYPTIRSPEKLEAVMVSNLNDPETEDWVAMRYAPTGTGLPDPRSEDSDGVINVQWDAPANESSISVVTVNLKLLGVPATGPGTGSYTEDGNLCDPAVVLEGDKDESWLAQYEATKTNWCDPGFEPDTAVGNDEDGLTQLGVDTCHNGVDEDEDGFCDEGGCVSDEGEWLPPDAKCARHLYQASVCGSDSKCRPVGGDRQGDAHQGDVICTAADDGDFTITAETISSLLSQVDAADIGGAVLLVTRTAEADIKLPAVRDPVGNIDDINPVRFRTSEVQVGRFSWE